jgi:hypothetical protein
MIQVDFDTTLGDFQRGFFDRVSDKVIAPKLRRFLSRAGGSIRKAAGRQFQSRAQKPLRELTPRQLQIYREEQALFKAGERKMKPRRPDKVALPGQSPRVHTQRKSESLLAGRIYYALADDKQSVVIGPDKLSGKSDGITLERLEQRFPFMEPAFEAIQPSLPSYWPR